MSSVHAGLSGSETLAEVFFGNLAVVASFMFFGLSKRDHVRAFGSLGVNHHNHVSGQKAKADQTLLAVVLPLVLARDAEVIPNCIASDEVKSVILDVQLAFGLVPCEHI